MKILINQNNGGVITIDKLQRGEDKISYTMYDNGVHYSLKIPLDVNPIRQIGINKTIVPNTYMNYNDYIDWITIQTILANRGNNWSEANASNVNWVFNKGVTNINTIIRVYIPFEQVGLAYMTNNSLKTYLDSISAQKPYSTANKQGIVQYFENITSQDMTLLSSYSSLIDYRMFTCTFTIQQNGVPIQGASILIGSTTKISDGSGLASFDLGNGSYSYIVSYPDLSTMTGTFDIVRTNKNITVNKV